MNNELKINMKVLSSDSIKMKLEDTKPIDVNMSGGIKEIDPIFTSSAAYTITFNDIYKWNHKSDFSGNYNDLTNKPLIPSKLSQLSNDVGYITKDVNNLVNYTLSSSLSTVATSGNYDDLINKPTLPTKLSDLENDENFVSSDTTSLENYTLTTNLSTVATSGDYDDLINKPTLATVATTGFYSDLINKPTLSTVASTGDYVDLLNKPTIPTKTSDLTNDSGFITNTVNDLTNYTLSSAFAAVATSGSYNDLSNTPTIPVVPTNVSSFTNDAGYITNTVNDLTNYTLSSSLSTVATSGSYNDLSNKPSIPTIDNSVSTTSTNGVENQAITNYVNNKSSFSKTESVIGSWLGKPLYRKVYQITQNLTTGIVSVAHGISNIDTVIVNTSKSFIKSSTGVSYNFPINQYNGGSTFDELGVYADRTNINFLVKTSWSATTWDIYVTLEYTKTTD